LVIGSNPFPTATLVVVPARTRIGSTVGRVDQEAAVPSVFKNLPVLPVCVGKLTGAACHEGATPAPLEVSKYPESPAPSLEEVFVAVPMMISPVVVMGEIELKDTSPEPSND
jgi:hypothetical protein